MGGNSRFDDRRVWIGWMNNWHYATTLPTSTWRSAMTLPREVKLVQTTDGIRLTQKPIIEFEQLRGERRSWENITIEGESDLLDGITMESGELIATFQIEPATDRFGLRVRVGGDEQTTIGYGNKQDVLFFDRSDSGNTTFNDNFTTSHTARLESADSIIKLHVIFDRSSVEVFANDGLVTMTERIFPSDESLGLGLFSTNGAVTLKTLEIYDIKRATR